MTASWKIIGSFGIAVTLGVVVWSCGGETSGSPTTPSSPSLAVSGPTAGMRVVTAWSCFTATQAGILSPGGDCATRRMDISESYSAALVAPDAPTNLASSVSGGTVTLTWVAPSSGDPATSYVIQAGSAPGASNVAGFDTGSAATSLTVSDVASGAYYVHVRSRNAAGVSAPSNEILLLVVNTSSCTSPPAGPTALVAAVSGSTVKLAWRGSAGATSYVIEAGAAPGASDLANVNTGSAANSLVAQNVSVGLYYVRVRASNACGVSGPSNEVGVSVR